MILIESIYIKINTKYDYEVPVIAIEGISSKEIIELPRISPRLKDDQLKNWFQKNINTFLKK